ncbi:PDZ domain-containing protein [Candidatus Poribacteria bacterium]|nr:PDZ domain-containing protein [Candidatus Poribacteria bacterium]MYK17231.1 PDZ domain-containing protein [Candidatus Poribacteria bacterium]
MHAKALKQQQLLIGLLGLLFYAIPFSFANESILQMFEKDFQKIVADARPAVVKVVATQVNSVWLQPNPKRLALTRQDIGSGILIDTTGHVATTTFEMENPGKIEIVFSDGKVSSAKLLGTDTLTDIAVLRVADTPLTTASKATTKSIKWGDSSKIDTGSWAVTIGSSYGHSPIISFGIVGGWDTLPDQMCGELIKINAAITPGNSGGAVVNTSGEIVGMILAVLTEPIGINSPANVLFGKQDDIDITQFLGQPSPLGSRNQEIAFALPIEAVRTVAKEIIEHGKVARGWLGVEVDSGESGVYVTRVIDGSPAHKSGLLPKDVILELDETTVRSYAELLRCVVTKRPDTSVQLKIDRNGTAQHCTVILGEKPVMPMPLSDSVPSIGR